MQNVNFQNTKILPQGLSIKKEDSQFINFDKQINQAATIEGEITVDQSSVILSTAYGKYKAPKALIPANVNISTGDKVKIEISFSNQGLIGTIVKINNDLLTNKPKLLLSSIALEKPQIARDVLEAKKKQTQTKALEIILSDLPSELEGEIRYLNIINIYKSSVLSQLFDGLSEEQTTNTLPVGLKILSQDEINSPELFKFFGEIVESKNNASLIKTDFGIISVNKELPLDIRIPLSLLTLNHEKVAYNIENDLRKFLRLFVENIQLLEELLSIAKYKAPKSNNNIIQTHEQNIFSLLMQNNNKERLVHLSDTASRIRNAIFYEQTLDSYVVNEWYAIEVPFYDKEKSYTMLMKIYKPNNSYVRFVIDLNLAYLGKISIDGLIKFQDSNKTVKQFSINISSLTPLDQKLKNNIKNILDVAKTFSDIESEVFFSS